MQQMTIIANDLDGVLTIQGRRFEDARGYFEESWNRRVFEQAGINADFVQDNHSMSERAGTLRGLHFQAPPNAQGKLVRCTRGAIFDVAVDIRNGSASYGRWVGAELIPDDGKQLYIPRGFLHGFVTLLPDTEVQYKCTDYYAPESDGSVRWDSLGIDWPLKEPPLMSSKDAGAMHFSEFKSPFVYGVPG